MKDLQKTQCCLTMAYPREIVQPNWPKDCLRYWLGKPGIQKNRAKMSETKNFLNNSGYDNSDRETMLLRW